LPANDPSLASLDFGNEISAFGRIIQQRGYTLADALRIKPAFLGFPGQAQVELSDERAVYDSSFSNFCIDIGMLRTARLESTL